MQLKMVVLPAPLGPMRPTISNSSTFNDTSDRARSPPKLIETPTASRTGIAVPAVQGEPPALQPPADRAGDRTEPVGLEDEGHDGQDAREHLDEIAGVSGEVLRQMQASCEIREVLAAEDIKQREQHDAAA